MFSSIRFLKISLCVLAVGASSVLLRSLSNNSKASSNEDYWAQTGLSPESLEDMLFSSYCGSNERYFLACIGALISAGEQKGLSLTLQGEWQKSQRDQSQREALEPWVNLYQRMPHKASSFPFKTAWHLIVAQTPELERAFLTGHALNGFMSILRDPHTYLMPIKQFHDVSSETEARQNIMGLTLARTEKHQVVVTRVVFGTPTYKAGVRVGDVVKKINQVLLQQLPRKAVNDLLKGDIGEHTTLLLVRDGQELLVQVLREQMDLPSVSLRVLEESNLAVLSINKFARGTCERVETLLQSLNKISVRGLLLDLRGNPGGSMSEANCITGLFIGPQKKSFEIRYLDPVMEPEAYYTDKKQVWSEALAVLIDGGSASSAEILAGAIRDHQRGYLVGDRTYGKGSFQEGAVWDHNPEIAIFETKGFFYLPSGDSPQLKGVSPDIAVKGANYKVYREDNQFLFPLLAPQFLRGALSSWGLKSPCQEVVTGEDKVVDKAASFLFCNDKVARVEK